MSHADILGKIRDGNIDEMSIFHGGVFGKRDDERKLRCAFVGIVGRDGEKRSGAVCVGDYGWGGAWGFFGNCSV